MNEEGVTDPEGTEQCCKCEKEATIEVTHVDSYADPFSVCPDHAHQYVDDQVEHYGR